MIKRELNLNDNQIKIILEALEHYASTGPYPTSKDGQVKRGAVRDVKRAVDLQHKRELSGKRLAGQAGVLNK